ncbi:uncharacterized protein LOC122011098 [Zingiber officinale]|uniref:uncharacterized protein LOC122011098 n=1 Tax=Zingiber officinale TaxID=94328 RepID=UPI001C4CC3B1|nr:uncharacterized protein LOC122011098 [Zingiber officinale]
MDQDPGANDDPATCSSSSAKGPQCSVISTYRAKIGGALRAVTVVWSKNMMHHSLSVSIDGGLGAATCKVELKPWPFWSKKGSKSFDVDGSHVDVSWNFRLAKFGDGPEPYEGYFVAVVSGDEVVLLLGDRKKKAYKKTRSRPSLEEATPVSKKETVLGKRSFAARATFDSQRSKEHDIVVEHSISDQTKDRDGTELWITVDGAVRLHVANLQWKFRGNEVVWIDQIPVQVIWDAHDWLFKSHALTHALFLFKPGLPEPVAEPPEDGEPEDAATSVSNNDVSAARGSSSEFCFFLHAWKMD